MGGSILWRAAAALRRRWRRDGGVRAGVLRNEIGMGAKAVAGALDLDDDGVVQQAVEQRGGDDGIAEDLAPFGEAAVGGEDHGAPFVASVDELEDVAKRRARSVVGAAG